MSRPKKGLLCVRIGKQKGREEKRARNQGEMGTKRTEGEEGSRGHGPVTGK